MAGGVRARGPLGEHRVGNLGAQSARTSGAPFSDPSLRGLVETEARGPQACRWPLCCRPHGALPSEGLGLPTSGKWYLMSRQLAMEHVTWPRRDRPQLHGGCKRGGVSARGRGQAAQPDGWSPHVCGPALATVSCAAWHTWAVPDGRPSFRGDRA